MSKRKLFFGLIGTDIHGIAVAGPFCRCLRGRRD